MKSKMTSPLTPERTKKSSPLMRLTMCPCGENVFRDSVTVGTVFVLYPETRRIGSYRCGRCLEWRKIETVEADILNRPDLDPAPVPAALFNWEEIQ